MFFSFEYVGLSIQSTAWLHDARHLRMGECFFLQYTS